MQSLISALREATKFVERGVGAAQGNASSVQSHFEQVKNQLHNGITSEALANLRAIPLQAASRSEIVRYTFECSRLDPDFQRLVSRGDSARDAGRLGEAEGAYGSLLNLYPFHHGYRVQYAHMLKDQKRYKEAEIHYRSALANGTPPGDVVEHLEAVLASQGAKGKFKLQMQRGDGEGFHLELPTSFDIDTLSRLLWNVPADIDSTLGLLRECISCEEVAVQMVHSPRFNTANKIFLKILKSQGAVP